MAPPSDPRPPTALALAAALLTLGCEPSGGSEPGAPLAVERPTIDFGRVDEGRILEHEWELGVRAPVRVSAAKTDCGCTLASLEREDGAGRRPYELDAPLAPGETLRVRVRYDTRGRRGPATRAVNLSLPDRVLALALAADVQPWLVAEPEDLPFTQVRESVGAEREFRVRSRTGEPFALVATRRALPPWVVLALDPERPDPAGRASAWRVRATLGVETPRGIYSYPLELESDVAIPGEVLADPAGGHARRYSLTPTWTLKVVGPVALSRLNLEFGLVGARETVAQSVRLESFDPAYQPSAARARLEPLRPGEACPLARTAQVHLRPAEDACEIELVLAGLDDEVSGTFLAKLVVETGHPGLPRLEALVRGVRSPAEGAR